MRVSPPRRVLIDDHAAVRWSVVVDEVPYLVVWWQSDGHLRVSWPRSDVREDWSPFVCMGPRWSPRWDPRTAHAAVVAWAVARESHCGAVQTGKSAR